MSTAASSQQERAEVESVLQSGIFEKAPRLGRFFTYICERYFDGHADQVKEYSIAIEALGRKPDFDPKKDSIVRVEAHRLRKRLEEFYTGPGAGHEIHVVIPNGQYRPLFLARADVPEKPPGPVARRVESRPLAGQKLDDLAATQPTPVPPENPRRQKWRWPWIALSVFLPVAGLGVLFLVLKTKSPPHSKAAVPPQSAVAETWNPATAPTGAEIRLLAGYHGPVFMDRQGHAWHPDAYFHGGTSRQIPADQFIEAQRDPHLLKSVRYGQFRYDIPLPAGTYELHLLFAETEYGRGNQKDGAEGTRTFNVSVNRRQILSLLDPLADAGGPNRLSERVLKDISPENDGALHLSFDGVSGPAILSGIEILPTAAGRIHPIRLITQENPVTDQDGRLWAADEYFIGGTVVLRENVLLHPGERALYRGERYGNFSYRLPLAPGKYRLTLYFAEQWFGTAASQMQPLDSRSFNVFANGVALLKDFHLGLEAGGPNRSVKKTFENIGPNAQGSLLLEFVPERNYAEVNALEVVETQ